jgi:vancomycin aglycone glucosyltransferase
MFGDQFYWASRVVALGTGATNPYTKMTEESLTGALQKVCDPAVVARARTLARQVGRDGATIAAKRLEAEYGAVEN